MTYETSSIWWLMRKPKGKPAFLAGLYLRMAGWPCSSMTVPVLSPINLATLWIFWQASLFSAIISPIMDRIVCRPAPSARYLELGSIWSWGKEYCVWFKDKDNRLNICCRILHLNPKVGVLRPRLLLCLIWAIVPKQPLQTLGVIKVIYFLLTWNTFSFTAT